MAPVGNLYMVCLCWQVCSNSGNFLYFCLRFFGLETDRGIRTHFHEILGLDK